MSEVVGFDLPGRGALRGLPRSASLADVVEYLAAAVAEPEQRPFVLYGHSLGALIAYEITCALLAAGLQGPEALIVGAAAAPHLEQWKVGRPKTVEELASFIERANGTPQELLASSELRRLFFSEVAIDLALLNTYAPKFQALAVPITAIGGVDDPMLTARQVESWSQVSASSFEFRMLPGGHFFFDDHPEPFFQLLDRCISGA